MFDWLYVIYDIPSTQLALMISIGFVLFYWVGCIFIRPFLRMFLRGRSSMNDMVGYILSCFCAFFGLLLGLLTLAVYQNYCEVEKNVGREAIALTALYQDVKSYPEPLGQNLNWLLRDYTRYVIKYAWPLQRQGIIPDGGRVRVNAFHEKLISFDPTTKGEEILHAEALRQFNVFFEARRMRLHSVTTGIPQVLWYVVLVGALINIAIVWMFDMKIVAHLLLGGLLVFFLGSMIFLIAAMDNPFRGEVSVSSEAFDLVYKTMIDESDTGADE